MMVGSVPLTVSGWGLDVLALKSLFPLYWAVNWYVPGGNPSFSVAVPGKDPLPPSTCTVPSTCLPFKNVTAPTVTGSLSAITVAVSVTTWPGEATDGETVSVVAVGTADDPWTSTLPWLPE